MTGLPTIVSFWHGPMSWLERLSVASFRRAGHRVEIYSYDPIVDMPAGATWRDAAEILPRNKLTFYKGRGTPGVFSDYFRMSLLRAARGVWADLDVYCLRPIRQPLDYLMGYERPGSVNGAVLYMPANAPLLVDLLSIFETSNRPLFERHLPLFRRVEVAARRLAGQTVAPEYMQYGATGPMALTYHAGRHRLLDKVSPGPVFYPVPYQHIPSLMRAGSSLDAWLTPQTLAVHLWRSQLTDRGRADIAQPEPGSALHTLCMQAGVALETIKASRTAQLSSV